MFVAVVFEEVEEGRRPKAKYSPHDMDIERELRNIILYVCWIRQDRYECQPIAKCCVLMLGDLGLNSINPQ